jgi:phosphoribosyl 1,2-cyclic phosphodiesterase
MITLCAIASGSNGNCYYVGFGEEAVLIDAGISAKQIIARLQQKQLCLSGVKALFISHEHADHCCGAKVLGKRLNIPVYVTRNTFKAMNQKQRPLYSRFFEPDTIIQVGDFRVYPFLKNHDAADPVSFRVECGSFQTGIFTDLGSVCKNTLLHLGLCHALFLETNYDEKMLWGGKYPWYLKQRIASDKGHLSNDQAYDLLQEHAAPHLQTVFLSHLSAENNTPDKVIERFAPLGERIGVHLTSRTSASEVVITRLKNPSEDPCLI